MFDPVMIATEFIEFRLISLLTRLSEEIRGCPSDLAQINGGESVISAKTHRGFSKCTDEILESASNSPQVKSHFLSKIPYFFFHFSALITDLISQRNAKLAKK